MELLILWLIAEFVFAVKAIINISNGVAVFGKDRLYIAPVVVAAIIAAAGGLAQAGIGAGQKKRANNRLGELAKKRKPFKTPSEIFDIFNMEQNNASSGFSAETLDYLTKGADTSLASGLGAATKLGADPNEISGILDGYFQDIFKIGGENELVKMKKFDGLINSLQLLAGNKEAEWASAENILKDQMQTEGSAAAAGHQNINSGFNLFSSAATSYLTSQLYKDGNTPGSGSDTALPPPQSSGGFGGQGLSPSEMLRRQNGGW